MTILWSSTHFHSKTIPVEFHTRQTCTTMLTILFGCWFVREFSLPYFISFLSCYLLCSLLRLPSTHAFPKMKTCTILSSVLKTFTDEHCPTLINILHHVFFQTEEHSVKWQGHDLSSLVLRYLGYLKLFSSYKCYSDHLILYENPNSTKGMNF